MNNVLRSIIALFSDSQIDEGNVAENYSEVRIELSCDDGKCPTQEQFDDVLKTLNNRDSLHLSILQNEEVIGNYDSVSDGTFKDFIDACQSCLNSNDFQIIVTIVKSILEQKVSIYYPGQFFNYLSAKSVNYLLEIFGNFLNGNDYAIFEVQDASFSEFSTQTIKFIPRGEIFPQDAIQRSTDSLTKIKNLCHCALIDKHSFVPDDFYPTVNNGSLFDDIFSRISILYSAVFLFDIFNVDGNTIDYKLNGYRTIQQKIDYSDIDIFSCELYYQIYNWVYDGGNVVDKIGLARNIISLNFNRETLKLSDTTFEAIKSSYKIYQKENIKQYIEIRNKISDQLIELQNKADKIVENFVGDYKKSFLAIVSFFLSVVVIRVVSKGDFTGGFTTEVTFLSIGFLMIFLIIMFFARWEINKQISRYTEYYNNLKDRYLDLLDGNDINRILNNDKDFNENKLFIEQRRKNYTILWIVSLVILFVVSVVLFLINNLNFCQLIKNALCCIGNILLLKQ